MKNNRFTQVLLVGLLCVQVAIVGHSYFGKTRTATQANPTFVDVGDSIRTLHVATNRGIVSLRLADGRYHLLVALKSTCVWCTEILPQIDSALQRVPKHIDVVIITAEDDTTTNNYLNVHGVHRVTSSLKNSDQRSIERTLTSRTPWAFLIDGNGVVRKSVHASDILEAANDAREE